MNWKTFFLMIVLLISLGAIVSSTELTFPTTRDIRINVDLINSSGLWNESGGNLYPHWSDSNLQVFTLVNCDTIDTDADGVMSCGTDATGAGEDASKWTRENTTDYLGGLNISTFTLINDSIIFSWNTTWRDEGSGSGLDTAFTNAIVNVSMLDNNTILRTINLSDISLYINKTSNASLYVTKSGDTMTGDLNMAENRLTDVGEIIVETITLKGNLTPFTDDLYSLGNSTSWLDELWVHDIYAHNINTTNLTATNIDSKEGDIENITSEELNMGSVKIQNISEDLVIILQ